MKKALIVGAGIAGKELLCELRRHKGLGINVVGFIDDDLYKQGKKVNKIPVVGKLDNLFKIIKQFSIEEVFIAIPSAKGSEIRDIIKACKEAKVSFKIIPRTLDVIQGSVSINQIRNIKIEDIIGREIKKIEQKSFKKFYKGKTILITGACGSIGSEICRQLLLFSPGKVILYDWWENGMFDLDLELKSEYPQAQIISVIGDVKDKKRIEKIFNENKPDLVFHAAAYKHVPLMEENPSQAVKNNILGTKIVAEVAKKSGVSYFVFISTDKAVDPESVMGATKRIAEALIHDLSNDSLTRFISVRFGNVLDSCGSVLPLFRKQILKGGPVTVTHKDATRYFMSIPEAVQLIFNATLIGKGGEIFILDMGEPIKIDEFAKLLVRLYGYTPEKDIKIIYTGLRPGEKLTERLFTEKEHFSLTKNERILSIENQKLHIEDFNKYIHSLLDYSEASNEKNVREKLAEIFHK